MRILFIRHGESTNNVILKLSREEYEKVREVDPEITELGN